MPSCSISASSTQASWIRPPLWPRAKRGPSTWWSNPEYSSQRMVPLGEATMGGVSSAARSAANVVGPRVALGQADITASDVVSIRMVAFSYVVAERSVVPLPWCVEAQRPSSWPVQVSTWAPSQT
ncbi:hypothetical protein BRD56_09620 [Thermoplasmatales archaeon SW_10_69_26]|nr:MAG: hypothetical protein BRD56_09620 [Thermoplasmatales archaeon SW_10_69_26]